MEILETFSNPVKTNPTWKSTLQRLPELDEGKIPPEISIFSCQNHILTPFRALEIKARKAKALVILVEVEKLKLRREMEQFLLFKWSKCGDASKTSWASLH